MKRSDATEMKTTCWRAELLIVLIPPAWSSPFELNLNRATNNDIFPSKETELWNWDNSVYIKTQTSVGSFFVQVSGANGFGLLVLFVAFTIDQFIC